MWRCGVLQKDAPAPEQGGLGFVVREKADGSAGFSQAA